MRILEKQDFRENSQQRKQYFPVLSKSRIVLRVESRQVKTKNSKVPKQQLETTEIEVLRICCCQRIKTGLGRLVLTMPSTQWIVLWEPPKLIGCCLSLRFPVSIASQNTVWGASRAVLGYEKTTC